MLPWVWNSGFKDCSHNCKKKNATPLASKINFSEADKGKEFWSEWKRGENSGAERRAPSYWVSGASWLFQLPATHTDTHVKRKATLPSLQEFLLNQAEDLCICWRSTPNMLPAPCAASPPMFRAHRQKKSPRSASRKLPKSFQLFSTCPASVEQRGKPQILRLPVDPELLL